MKMISDAGQCYVSYGFLTCSCGGRYNIDQYPNLNFSMGGKVFTLSPRDYFWQDGSYCQLLLSAMADGKFWIMGDVFLRKYYSIYDMDAGLIGLVPSVNVKQHKTSWSWIGAGALVVVCAGLLVRQKMSRKNEDNYQALLS
jgi:hypothetical protein